MGSLLAAGSSFDFESWPVMLELERVKVDTGTGSAAAVVGICCSNSVDFVVDSVVPVVARFPFH